MAVARYRTRPPREVVVSALTPGTHRFYLTRRQAELLYWLSLGLQLPDVSDVMGGISYHTAKTIARHLYRRMRVRNAAEAVRVGFESGLLTPRASAGLEGHVADGRRGNAPPSARASALRCDDGREPAPEDQRLP